MTHKYIVLAAVVGKLETLNLGANALKLAHGMLLHADLAVNGETNALWRAMNTPALVRASFLREELGWASQKGNRPLRTAVADSGLRQVLKNIAVTSNGRGVMREFHQRFIETATVKNFDPVNRKSKYALMDTACVGQCRTREDLLLLTRVSMHRRQDFPKFELAGVGRQEQIPMAKKKTLRLQGSQQASADGGKTEPDSARWASSRDKWLQAARKASKMTGDTLLFRVIEGIADPGVMKVEVLISNSDTNWDPDVFFKSGGGRRLILVTDKGHRNLSSVEAKARAAGEEVPGQQS
ncbi:hypothetical protein RSK20926_02172 [Roseobacter sp. SK209-2-6]|uniref:hypothetical protein n=1 Tax=Roseobacter sp. SK209-2-6 TaxID=388739 RepID=UPI0000F3E3D8|nr:hypothetical protein [Roseobacter sp. SK209-2-6]EBA14437.1 hypothetical protein RSK20926_02172 [Roseobacter sp. SK209-2-6]